MHGYVLVDVQERDPGNPWGGVKDKGEEHQ